MKSLYLYLVLIPSLLPVAVFCAEKKALLVLTVASKATDGFKRLERSLLMYDLDYKVLGMGQEWNGRKMDSIGGGQKVNILREEMRNHKDKENLVILFVDGYDVVVTGNEDEILSTFASFDASIVFGAEDYCWPDKSLQSQYPKVRHGYKYLNSGGFIGYAPQIYEIIRKDIKDDEDDQLFYTKVFLDPDRRQTYNIKLDTQAKLFQNLHGVENDVSLVFEEDDSVVMNTVYQSTPFVVHGNGFSKYHLNSLGNYIAKSWIMSYGCTACLEKRIFWPKLKESNYPQVLIGVFIEIPTPFLEEMLEKVAKQKYPEKKVSLFVHNSVPIHEDAVFKWVERQKNNDKYDFVKFVSSKDEIKDWHARNLAITKCLESSCDIYFSVDSDVHLDNEETLMLLISYNRSIIAPVITRVGKAWSTFWGAISDTGFYARSLDYMDIIGGARRGIWNVPHISGAYLIKRSVLEDPDSKPNYIHKLFDADMAMTANMRENGVFMYAVNLDDYGHLVEIEAVATKELHNDLWQVAANKLDWEEKYLHPQYYEQLLPETVNEMPCQDVFWLPFFTARFCKELIETTEHANLWSAGKNEDPRLTGGYENVPTVDTHMNQIGYEQEWLHILKTYVKPLAEKLFLGYNSDARAIMNFVVRYKPTEQSFLRPHHDSSTYSINVALNKPGVEYEGGGSRFIRFNCSVIDSRVGWAILHPGRLTHYHEGLQTTKGTRYIMVSFIDP